MGTCNKINRSYRIAGGFSKVITKRREIICREILERGGPGLKQGYRVEDDDCDDDDGGGDIGQ
jgi:hypothetical protein